MGKGQFKLRLGRKSNRELNPMEKWRRKLKDRDKLKRLVGRLSHKEDFPNPRKLRKPREEEEDIGKQDPMLGELMTTNRLRGEEEQPKVESEEEEQEAIVEKTEIQVDVKPEKGDVMVPSSCVIKRPLSVVPTSKNPALPEELSDEENLDSFAVDSFLVSVAAPAQVPESVKTVRQQPNFKRMLDEDKDMIDFYEHMGDLL